MIVVNFKNIKKVKWGMFLALWVACLAIPAQPVYAMDRRDVIENPQILLLANHAWGAPAEEFNKFMRVMDNFEVVVRKILSGQLLPSTGPSSEENWDREYKDYVLYTKILSNNMAMFGLANKAYNLLEDAGEGMNVENLIATILTPLIENAESNKSKGEEEIRRDTHFNYKNGKYAAFVKNLKRLRTKISGLTHETAPEFLKGVEEESDPIINAIKQSYFPMTKEQVMQTQKKMLTWVELKEQIDLQNEAKLKAKPVQTHVSKEKSLQVERKMNKESAADILEDIDLAREIIMTVPTTLRADAVIRTLGSLSGVSGVSGVADEIRIALHTIPTSSVYGVVGDLLEVTNQLVQGYREENQIAITKYTQAVEEQIAELAKVAHEEQSKLATRAEPVSRGPKSRERSHRSNLRAPQSSTSQEKITAKKETKIQRQEITEGGLPTTPHSSSPQNSESKGTTPQAYNPGFY